MSEEVLSKYKYIDNALLFFLFNKVDCMRETDLLYLCKDFYKTDEIDLAKSIVFELYKKTEEKVNRKGSNKLTSDLQDIIKLIRTNIPPEEIKFCVTSCDRLPPVTLDHIDVSALLKNITDLKLQFYNLSSISEEVKSLKLEIEDIKLWKNNENNSHTISSVKTVKTPNVKDIVKKLDIQSSIKAYNEVLRKSESRKEEDSLTYISDNNNNNSPKSCENITSPLYHNIGELPLPNNKEPTSDVDSCKNLYPNINELKADCNDVELNEVAESEDLNCYLIETNDSNISSDQLSVDLRNSIKYYHKTINNKEIYKSQDFLPSNYNYRYKKNIGIHTRHRRNSFRERSQYRNRNSNNRNLSSYYKRPSNSSINNWRHRSEINNRFQLKSSRTLPAHRLRASRDTVKKNCTLFITRIDTSESVDTVRDHIYSVFGNNIHVKVFELDTKYNTYSSFKVTISNIDRSVDVFDNIYWPRGVLVREFI